MTRIRESVNKDLSMNTSKPNVSIIVPVLNREMSIGRCIEALLEQDYPRFEIIVVDNGSIDNTVSIVKSYPVKLIHEPVKGPYKARNSGMKAAKGPLVLFIDSDCVARKNLLKSLVSALLKHDTAGVGGPLQSHEPATIVEHFSHHAGIVQYTCPRGQLNWDKTKFLSGAIFTSNAMFRKDVLEKLGGFENDFMSGGDYDLCWRLQRAGYTIYFEPDAVVYHIHRSDLKGLIKQFFKYGLEQPKLLKKQPGRRSYIKIKTFVLPHIEFVVRSPVQMLVNIDACTLFPVSILLSFFYAPFVYVSAALVAMALAGAEGAAAVVVKETRELKWLLLFPFFHLVRDYAFTAGRIAGAIKQRILSF